MLPKSNFVIMQAMFINLCSIQVINVLLNPLNRCLSEKTVRIDLQRSHHLNKRTCSATLRLRQIKIPYSFIMVFVDNNIPIENSFFDLPAVCIQNFCEEINKNLPVRCKYINIPAYYIIHISTLQLNTYYYSFLVIKNV